MKTAHRRTAVTGLLLITVAAVAPSQTASPNLSVYVSLGDSLTAGISSGSLVQTHQANSYPALIAREAGVSGFQQPTVAEPGIPPELMLVNLLPTPSIAPKASFIGVPTNLGLTRPYNNLGVPGASTRDLRLTTTDGGGFHDLILRRQGTTALVQGASLRPTFVTVWIGNNDVLGAAVSGRAIEGVTLTPTATFRQNYTDIIQSLKTATSAMIFAANLPDVTSIPYVTTIKPYVVNPSTGVPVRVNGQTVPLIGPNGSLPPETYVLLSATEQLSRGFGIPTAYGGNGRALSDDVILDANEVATIRDYVARDNDAIRSICAAANVEVVDMNAALAGLSTTGIVVGGARFTSAFLTGGIFSYDGIHPTDLGYAVVANQWIQAINAKGGSLPLVNLAPYLGVGARSAGMAAPAFVFTREAYESLAAVFPKLDAK